MAPHRVKSGRMQSWEGGTNPLYRTSVHLSTVTTVDINTCTKWTFPKVELLLCCINCSIVDGHVCGAPGDLITWVLITTYGPGGYFDGLLSVHLS